MTVSVWLSLVVLSLVQGGIVLLPGRADRQARFRVLGLLLPAALLVAGVVVVQDVSGGAKALAYLATFGTPVAAVFAGCLSKRNRPWLPFALVPGLYVLAWLVGGRVGEAAGVVLIVAACVAGAAAAERLLPRRELTIGLLLLVCLDVILVFGTSQVSQTTTSLHAIRPLTLAGHSLPALQDVTFASATMGWLDVFAPALLGVILVGSSRRLIATASVVVAALAWDCLLYTTPLIPATVPVLAGLIAGQALRRRRLRVDPVTVSRPAALSSRWP